jgi:hypothetical protein
VGEPCSTWAAASGSGCVRLTLTPPRDAMPGDYPFRAAMVSGGAVVGSGPVALLLRVTPAAQQAPAIEPVRVDDPEAVVPPVTPVKRATRARTETTSGEAGDSTPGPARRIAARKAAVQEPAVSAPEPPVVNQAPAPDPAVIPLPADPPVDSRLTPAVVPPSEPEEDLPVIDYDSHPHHDEEDERHDDEETEPAEPSLIDPQDGTIIALCPGETRWVRFTFVNDSAQERTYILDEDRSLELGWISLVQDQVNLTRNGRGEVSIRLTPPKNAEPGDYPFLVTVGLQGGTLTPISLTLSVLATPAVRLSAKTATVSVGPAGCDVDFPLTVDSAGNADTAFRIAVKSPTARANAAEPAGPEFIYETAQWRYLFDRELDTLRSPSSGRAPQPAPIRLKLRRRGIWWFGFRESHQVRVSAAPVTDPSNGGKAGNTVDLTAVRWRIVPFPWFVFVPLLLLLTIYLSGGASSVDVPGAYQDESGQYWVVNPAGDEKNLDLEWKAAPLALLRLTGHNGRTPILNKVKVGGGIYADKVAVSNEQRRVINDYRISRLVGGGDRDALVSFVFTRSDTPLLVTDAVTRQPLTGNDISVTVPAQGYARVDLRNMSPQSTRIDWWLTKGLQDSSPFKLLYSKNEGSIEEGGVEHLLISRNPNGPEGAADRIVFVTTDANRPVVTINLTSGQ